MDKLNKEKKRTPVFLTDDHREKAVKIAYQEVGTTSFSDGIRIALKAFRLKGK